MYDDYLITQAKYGHNFNQKGYGTAPPIFYQTNRHFMRGSGIFRTLFKMAKPLMKKAGKFAVTSGSKYLSNTIGDLIDGKHIKTAIGNSNKKLAKKVHLTARKKLSNLLTGKPSNKKVQVKKISRKRVNRRRDNLSL